MSYEILDEKRGVQLRRVTNCKPPKFIVFKLYPGTLSDWRYSIMDCRATLKGARNLFKKS